MSSHILWCNYCKKYTLKPVCCGEKTIQKKPAKWNPKDKYGNLRRQAKEEN